MTAFEARYSNSLRRPSQIMAYVVFTLYFIYTLGQVLNVKWSVIDPTSSNLVIIATWQAGFSHITGFLNACLVIILVSSSATCLYIASRILYGLANDIPGSSVAALMLHLLGTKTSQTGVPGVALGFSFLMSISIPLIHISLESRSQDVSRLQGLIIN